MECIAVICIVLFLVILAWLSKKSSYIFYVDIIPRQCSEKEQAILNKQEYERWLKKANLALDAFLKEYKYVTSEDCPYDPNVEDMEAACDRCIELWRAYWATQEGICVRVHAKEYMQSRLSADFEPCMTDSTALRKRLASVSEYKKLSDQKRMEICSEILRTVAENKSIMRCKMLKMDIGKASYAQIDSCYQHLLLKNQLVEYKNGNRYYVSLVDRQTGGSTMMDFSSYWDPAIHNELSQVKSRIGAAKIKASDITMDRDNSCRIAGSGAEPYYVTLSYCNCQDFLINKKGSRPCKHIYRLASQLGIYDLLPKKNPSGAAAVQAEIPNEIARWEREFLAGNISPEKYVKIVEALQMK